MRTWYGFWLAAMLQPLRSRVLSLYLYGGMLSGQLACLGSREHEVDGGNAHISLCVPTSLSDHLLTLHREIGITTIYLRGHRSRVRVLGCGSFYPVTIPFQTVKLAMYTMYTQTSLVSHPKFESHPHKQILSNSAWYIHSIGNLVFN